MTQALAILYFVAPPAAGYWLMKRSGADFARATIGALWLFCMAVAAFVLSYGMFRRIGDGDPDGLLLLFVSAVAFSLILAACQRLTR